MIISYEIEFDNSKEVNFHGNSIYFLEKIW